MHRVTLLYEKQYSIYDSATFNTPAVSINKPHLSLIKFNANENA